MVRSLVVLAALCLSLLAPPEARAGAPLAGTWKHVKQTLTFAVQEWGDACGQRPQDVTQRPKRSYEVSDEGGKIRFSRRRRKLGTHDCLSENPEMKFQHYDAATRTTTCATAAANPKMEKGRYTLKIVDDNTITYTGSTKYDWSLQGTRCKATMKESHRFERTEPVKPEPVAAPQPTPAPEPEPIVVQDVDTVARSPKPARRAKNDKGFVLDLGGEGDPGSAGGLGGLSDERHQVGTAATRRGATLAMGIVLASIAIFLFAAGFLFVGKRRRAAGSSGEGGGAGAEGGGDGRPHKGGGGVRAAGAHHSRPRMVCPKCHREYDAVQRYCPYDAEALKEADSRAQTGNEIVLALLICPLCQREYGINKDVCDDDGTELLPLVGQTGRAGARYGHRHGHGRSIKICPHCTSRYGKGITYCGNDGNELVPLN